MVLAQTLPQRRTLTGSASSCAQCVPKFRAQHPRRNPASRCRSRGERRGHHPDRGRIVTESTVGTRESPAVWNPPVTRSDR